MKIFILAIFILSTEILLSADGKASFQTRCVICHGDNGTGSDRAGSILPAVHSKTAEELKTVITKGVPSRGMPAFEMSNEELQFIVEHLKKLAEKVSPAARDPRAPQPIRGLYG